jgi:hypothetical protein
VAKWLLNKTPDIVASWMVLPDFTLLVAVEHGTILAVGGVTKAGGDTRVNEEL